MGAAGVPTGVARLRRVLSAWDLVLYGLVAVTPSAPSTVFGLAERMSHGHAVVTILAAMVAMVLTAISYGRMAPCTRRLVQLIRMLVAGCIRISALCQVGLCFSTMW